MLCIRSPSASKHTAADFFFFFAHPYANIIMLMAVIEAVISLLFDTLAQISASPPTSISSQCDRSHRRTWTRGGGEARDAFLIRRRRGGAAWTWMWMEGLQAAVRSTTTRALALVLCRPACRVAPSPPPHTSQLRTLCIMQGRHYFAGNVLGTRPQMGR